MIKQFIEQWEENKRLLEEYFRTTTQSEYSEYDKILKKILELVVKEPVGWYDRWDTEKITAIDDGDYQGTLLFVVPVEKYQPSSSEYMITAVDYGSCSGCDTLERIRNYEDGLPDEEQVKDYMMLALHMVQSMKMPYNTEAEEM